MLVYRPIDDCVSAKQAIELMRRCKNWTHSTPKHLYTVIEPTDKGNIRFYSIMVFLWAVRLNKRHHHRKS